MRTVIASPAMSLFHFSSPSMGEGRERVRLERHGNLYNRVKRSPHCPGAIKALRNDNFFRFNSREKK
jgi:hypothetical protein